MTFRQPCTVGFIRDDSSRIKSHIRILSCTIVQVEVPESWAPIIRQEFNNTSRNIELTYYDTQLVFTGSDRDERLGLWPFPEKRGQLSTALLDAISSSGLDLWPDWEGDSISDQVWAMVHFGMVPKEYVYLGTTLNMTCIILPDSRNIPNTAQC